MKWFLIIFVVRAIVSVIPFLYKVGGYGRTWSFLIIVISEWYKWIVEELWRYLKEQKQPPEVFYKKNVHLEISQNWQENICAKFSFLIKLQAWGLQFRDSGGGVFLWILWNS